MTSLLHACNGLPTMELLAGDVLMVEGQPMKALFVVVSGSFVVTRGDSVVATVDEPGAILGETALLLGTEHRATVTATSAAVVHVVSDIEEFIGDNSERLLEIARILARRLDRLSSYLGDVRSQYSDAGGHLELLDEVLAELAFGQQPAAEPGSERDPDPLY
jgi:CRP/FNR family cyclic AMP-dependent transcriptional regulator